MGKLTFDPAIIMNNSWKSDLLAIIYMDITCGTMNKGTTLGL